MNRFIIEGIKCSGKSTITDSLRENFRASSVLEFRSYFDSKNKMKIGDNLIERLNSLVSLVNTVPNSDFLILRGHLFPFAYTIGPNKFLFNNSESIDIFTTIDDAMLKSNFKLILLTIDEDTFNARNHVMKKSGRNVRPNDSVWERHSIMQDLLFQLFHKSKLPKLHFDSSLLTVDKIIDTII